MKKVLLQIVMGTLMLSSCLQNEEIYYSCNDRIDSWVKENYDIVKEYTREQWNELPSDVAIAVYRTFTPDKRIEFWQEKFNELKCLPWDEEELAHIQIAENYFHAHEYIFRRIKLTADDVDDLDTFYYSWTKKAVKRLGWSERLATMIIASGYSLKDTTSLGKFDPDIPIIPGDKPNCNCRYFI